VISVTVILLHGLAYTKFYNYCTSYMSKLNTPHC